jgi:hypothetical protein
LRINVGRETCAVYVDGNGCGDSVAGVGAEAEAGADAGVGRALEHAEASTTAMSGERNTDMVVS